MYAALGAHPSAATVQPCREHCEQNFPGDPVCLVDCHCYNSCWLLYDDESDVIACTTDCQADLEPQPAPPPPAHEDLLGQLTNGQQCYQRNGEIICVSKQSQIKKEQYIYFGVGIAAGLTVGALVGYMVG